MGKNNKKAPAVEAPVVKAPEVKAEESKKPAQVNVMQVGDLDKLKESYAKNGGLDPNHRVDVLMGIKTYFKDDPNAAANTGVPQEAVDKINGIAAIGFVAALGDEIMMGQSGWAKKMRMTQIEAINSVQEITGISINIKALPAPDKDGNVDVPDEAIKVSKETKKALDKAKKVNDEAASGKKDYLEDHTKIETDEQLKEALGFQLVNLKVASPIDRLITAAQFYRSYLEARAEKSDNPEAELSKIHEYSLPDLLQDITTMVPPSFALEGFGKHLSKLVTSNKTVVPAFNIFKKAATKRNTNICKFTDEEIATLVRIIVVWNCTANIAAVSNDLKLLNKDAEKNAKAIAECSAKISEYQTIMGYVTDPKFDLADDFIGAYNNEENPLHNAALASAKSIVDTYYKDAIIPELENDSLLLNIQQHIGITLNLFNTVDLRRDEYSADNLIKFDVAGESKSEETDEGTKNS